MRKSLRLIIITVSSAFLLALPVALEAQVGAEGVRLWSQNCGRCHNFRPATERTDREWVTIVSHMRARAGLTRSAAAEILAFLQATNVDQGASAAVPAPEPIAVAVPDVLDVAEIDEIARLPLGFTGLDDVVHPPPEPPMELPSYWHDWFLRFVHVGSPGS